MEGETITTSNLITTINKFNGTEKQHGTIKTLIKNFILADSDMAIKENQNSNKPIYTAPSKPPIAMNNRVTSINQAKQAFLNSTIVPPPRRNTRKEPTLHYAQLAMTTLSEDTRSTGGGKEFRHTINNDKQYVTPMELYKDKKKVETQQRKVSFKIKNSSTSHKRPPLPTKTVTITGNKVSELTKKFNNLVNEPHIGSKLVKTIEELQMVSRYPTSSSSSPTSTLSPSPSIQIVVRQRKNSKRRNIRKRCSSMDSIDKLILADNSSAKLRVIRSKSDGTKIPKSPKKRVKTNYLTEQQSGSDSVDGSPVKKEQQLTEETRDSAENTPDTVRALKKNGVKSVIKKFECEIAQSNLTNTLKKQNDQIKSTIPLREKPKVPEKKSSLVLTKNVVVKDGVPKIKTLKPVSGLSKQENPVTSNNETSKKRESIYDKNKFRTNYINKDKLSLKVVEIIEESIDEVPTRETQEKYEDPVVLNENQREDTDKSYQDISSNITPNESFLWRRKSDSERSFPDSPYGFVSISTNGNTLLCSDDLKETSARCESQNSNVNESHSNEVKLDSNSDFESNLVEAFNNEVMVGYTSKPKKEAFEEDDYETFEPREADNVVVIPVKPEKFPKINCPLPEIPKPSIPDSPDTESDKDNIYQCLLEMRSHPEGDESSMNYEVCEANLEERTRGDGDSDDGYEYCKSPIKPYCITSSSGIQIAEGYDAEAAKKQYAITKSVSGTSTVSYEKIGSERIYEKIPTPKSKDNANYSNRHSFVSSDYTSYTDDNIYDTIKQGDAASLSHCYESIPNSPSMVKLRTNFRRQLSSAVQKRLSFDNMSNLSQSTASSEQKTNSIYGQRSVLNYNGQEMTVQVPGSDTSVSDRSDRSDDWVDISDEEKTDEQKIIIVRERSRSKRSPISWSQKVRHQWQKSPKQKSDNTECDSSDSGHVYESLEPAPAPAPLDDDFDSFDSDTDDEHDQSTQVQSPPALPSSRLPSPPSGGPYTLTKFASAAQKKMRQIKRNLTKRYSVAMDVNPFAKSPPAPAQPILVTAKNKVPPPEHIDHSDHVYSNVNFDDTRNNKTETPTITLNGFKDELNGVLGEKRLSNGDIPPPLPEKSSTTVENKKDSGTLSRKTYFSFKSRFRRATSIAVDINSDVPGALKITNSTFYLTDSMDGDSGFSNSSDTGAGPERRRREGTRLRPAWSESSPCLALERPAVPPPPPPAHAPHTDISAVNEELKRLLPTLSRKDKGPRTRTSWYAECGADTPSGNTSNTSNTSWYAESGVYQGSSSGASSGSHPASPLPTSLFTHEPLYQFYNQAKLESVCTGDSDSEAYEASAPARPSAMALVAPRGPARTLWCEVPEVLSSAVLSSLAPAQKRLQEAKFELLTSEASYLNSLNVLEAHFISHPAFRDTSVLPREDWESLFSTILPVRACSQQLMKQLEQCWQENILLQGICDLVREHAESHFHVYVAYCSQQALMGATLQRLKERPNFVRALRKLESVAACQALSLHSFLMLPMQRVTRLPLLLDAVLRHLAPQDAEHDAAMHALATLNNFVLQCNEGARSTEREQEMLRLARAIDCSHVARPPDLWPASARRDRKPVRWLVRSGEMTQLVWKADELKLTFGKKFHKVPLHLFLFNDLLVITKKKGEGSYVAVDHCPRALLEVSGAGGAGGAGGARHPLLLTLLENHDARTVEMLMSCSSETDASRWAEALAPAPGRDGDAVYAGWDCPQVAALYAYAAAQPDELPLCQGDVVNVTRKTSEGWYYGERTRDGEAGWFPGAYTAEIASAHVRARNLRQRYRLLALSSTYLGQRKRLV